MADPTPTLAERVEALLRDALSPAFAKMVRDAGALALTDKDAGSAALERLETGLEDHRRRALENIAEVQRARREEAERRHAAMQRVSSLRRLYASLPDSIRQPGAAYLEAGDLDAAEKWYHRADRVQKDRIADVFADALPLSWLGDWRAEIPYRPGYVVWHAGMSFVALEETREAPSIMSDQWHLLVHPSAGSPGGAGAPGAAGASAYEIAVENGFVGTEEEWLDSLVGTPGDEEMPLALQLDVVDGGVTYVGEAEPGSAQSAAVWRIKKLTEVGDDMTVLWADGTADFVHIWDDRAQLAYS